MAIKIKIDGTAKVLFDTITGTKIRVSPEPYLKSTTPELVDIKVTNYCPYGCSFCYQSSTKKGRHADPVKLFEYAHWMAAMGVFEVALGGGEPTMYPGFAILLKNFKKLGVVPNFTTFGVDWLSSSLLEVVEENVGGIGVSVHSTKELAKYGKIKKAVHRPQVLAQHVFGTIPIKDLLVLSDSVDHLLLLGYKSVGFGGLHTPITYFPDEVAALFATRKSLSVDTAFLDIYGAELDKLGVPVELRSSPEGKFSCYLDAVEGLMGPSSYSRELYSVESLHKFRGLYGTF